MPVEISKDELRQYLKTFLRMYRDKVRRFQAYFNKFPFYSALKAIGVITPNKVYIIFTKDGNPKRTTIEVFDESDIPELMKVKDAYNPKRDDICELLGIETYIPDFIVGTLYEGRTKGGQLDFNEENTIRAVDLCIEQHYRQCIETGKDITKVRELRGKTLFDMYKPPTIPEFSFVYNTMDETLLREKVKEITGKAEEGEEILITGWIGAFGVRLLKSLMKRKVKVRIITHKPPSPKKGKSPSDEYEVFRTVLTQKYPENVRILPKLHARLLISDKEALVSTADLTKDSHESKYEAGISTTDGLMILKLKDYFEKMWKTSTRIRGKRRLDIEK